MELAPVSKACGAEAAARHRRIELSSEVGIWVEKKKGLCVIFLFLWISL
jgi:hypothetical protein